jgi:hypothetical protein
VEIRKDNMYLLHSLWKKVESVAKVVNQDVDLIEEVSSWARDLETLESIKSQKYRIVMAVYCEEELDKIDDLIKNIKEGKK